MGGRSRRYRSESVATAVPEVALFECSTECSTECSNRTFDGRRKCEERVAREPAIGERGKKKVGGLPPLKVRER